MASLIVVSYFVVVVVVMDVMTTDLYQNTGSLWVYLMCCRSLLSSNFCLPLCWLLRQMELSMGRTDQH